MFSWGNCVDGSILKVSPLKLEKMISMRSLHFSFELTNDILVQHILKNKAWFQTKKYCIHQHNNRKAIGRHFSIHNFEPCSSKKPNTTNAIMPKSSMWHRLRLLFFQVIWNLPVAFDYNHQVPTTRHSMTPHKSNTLQCWHRMWNLYHRRPRLNYFWSHIYWRNIIYKDLTYR